MGAFKNDGKNDLSGERSRKLLVITDELIPMADEKLGTKNVKEGSDTC